MLLLLFHQQQLGPVRWKETIPALGASGPSDMEKVMGAVMGKLKGKADGSLISSTVKGELGKV